MIMSFWRKEHHPDKGIVVHYCDQHNFSTTNPSEIEEHERIHTIEEGNQF